MEILNPVNPQNPNYAFNWDNLRKSFVIFRGVDLGLAIKDGEVTSLQDVFADYDSYINFDSSFPTTTGVVFNHGGTPGTFTVGTKVMKADVFHKDGKPYWFNPGDESITITINVEKGETYENDLRTLLTASAVMFSRLFNNFWGANYEDDGFYLSRVDEFSIQDDPAILETVNAEIEELKWLLELRQHSSFKVYHHEDSEESEDEE